MKKKSGKKDKKEQEAGSSDAVAADRKKSVKFEKVQESHESFVSASSTTTEEDNETVPVALPVSYSKLSRKGLPTPRVADRKTYVEGSREFILEEDSSHVQQTVSSEKQLFSDVNMRLIHAIHLRRTKDAKKAIANGANVNCLFSLESPLLIATEMGDSDMVSYLLTVPKININQKNEYGQAALSVAVRNSFEQIVSLLLNAGADVNTQDHLGRTPLQNALFQRKKRMVYRLLAFNANMELEDCFGERAIYTAAVKNPNLPCLKALLLEGASVNYQNFSKVPLISRVIMNGTQFSIIETLIEFGASVNEPDLAKRTPLHYTALSNHLPAAKILVENGADIHLKCHNNFTALDKARAHRSRDVTQYLESLQPRSSELALTTLKRNRKTCNSTSVPLAEGS